MSRLILLVYDSAARQGQRQNSDVIDKIAEFWKSLEVGELSNHKKLKPDSVRCGAPR